MFREVARKKQALPIEECIEILIKEPRGVLSVLGDDDYPYGMPLNHYYCEEAPRVLRFLERMRSRNVVYENGIQRKGGGRHR